MSFIIDLIRQPHLPLPLRYIPVYGEDAIMKSICAFLNASGGWIVVGIDSHEQVMGVDEKNAAMNLQQLITNCVSPIPLVYIQEEQYSGKTVLLLTVMNGGLGPYAYNGKIYVMVDDEVAVPDKNQLSVLFRQEEIGLDKWELKTCMSSEVEDLDSSLLSSTYQKGKSRNRVISNDEEQLVATLRRLRLLGSSTVSNGAMALFGLETTDFLRQCRVRIQLMLNGKTADTYQDVHYIEGNMFKTHQKVLKYFSELPRIASFSDKNGLRKDNYMYPLDVIDEAITNALIHRSYNGFLEEITIFIYKDKVEISNPGEMLGDFIVRGKVVPHGSVLRNPVMAEVFYMSGLMEKTGRGLALIYDGMYGKGYKKPTWKSGNGRTTLTIYTSKTKVASLNDRMVEYLKEHRMGDSFAKGDYMERFNKISKITAQTDIQKLVELGYCKVKGNGPSTKYIIIKTDR